ncbi:Uncharacterised protein [Anaerobiospirillum thomasii]|uniref:macro domain-containing protein n=1 Tax=Anaerobiospirillum thomasii TaxID=179995 RepID=UPI000D8707D2|nr:macro domain-containing protein [Anaerobiospirillum thomasii]SPT68334.1 Uncharacterised protein [Anaerobiospirillum thomasii]
MIDRLRLFWKLTTGEVNTLKGIYKLICTAIGYISSFYSLAVLFKDLAAWDKLEVFIKEHWHIIMIVGLLFSCVINRKMVNYIKKVSNRDMELAICVQDIFSIRGANSYIIPTNTFFRTQMQDEYISYRSVQGRFQLKYFKKNIHNLDKKISESLELQGLSGDDVNDCFGTTKKYPIGTVAKINHEGKHFYFVALNDVNKYGKPIEQSIENVSIALKAVVDAILEMGHCDTLCVPLIGSGRAAIKEATKESVSRMIIDCFVNSKDKIANKVIISINPRDYLDDVIDFEQLKIYLDYKCEFC